ncbi:hypothetical protein MA16_Dca001858 [Dendrobium catenatum]|uniref:Uncharacterized protein n=1 Tax=Dendrobium catenatum TaxID=906689 RepID=A0A2I0XDM2_9ASPA|nr:hypothetical protein MA16_Dca001858 [Dendrobium catenatum]
MVSGARYPTTTRDGDAAVLMMGARPKSMTQASSSCVSRTFEDFMLPWANLPPPSA